MQFEYLVILLKITEMRAIFIEMLSSNATSSDKKQQMVNSRCLFMVTRENIAEISFCDNVVIILRNRYSRKDQRRYRNIIIFCDDKNEGKLLMKNHKNAYAIIKIILASYQSENFKQISVMFFFIVMVLFV